MSWKRGAYRITDDPSEIDIEAVHRFLTESYWAHGISREVVGRSMRHSLSFGVLRGDRTVGFARAVTDRATFAYLADVVIDEAERGHGLGAWLVETILSHPELRGLRRWLLVTRDANDFYRRFGFREVADPSTLLTLYDPDIYTR